MAKPASFRALRRRIGRKSKPDDVIPEEAVVLDEAPPPLPAEAAGRAFRYRSTDGLPLFARDYGDPISPWLPVVCLPGLTRNSRDFEPLALHLSSHRHRPRRVVAFDYRGRGHSAWDPNVDHYNPLTEMTDVLDGLAALAISRAIIVGTSRGGIIAMLMAVARPGMMAGLVLNDVGPVLDPRGLARIKTYVGRTPVPDNWDDAVAIMRRLHGAQFPGLSDEDWQAWTRLTYRDEGGRPVSDYDPGLAGTLDGIEFDKPIPNLWNEFKALAGVPTLVIRGENSDLLAENTLAAMTAAHPGLDSITVAGEGHPPLLRSTQLLQKISVFITGIEAAPAPDAIVPRPLPVFDLDAVARGDDGGAS